MIEEVEKNTPFELFYRAKNLAAGKNVIFNIWDDTGSHLLVDEPATEITPNGVYYILYTSPNADTYICVKAEIDDGTNARSQIVKVGNPTRQTFYSDTEFEDGKTFAYEIYDETPTTLQSGNLTDLGNGFYKTTASGLPSLWFFEVHPLIKKGEG